MTAEQASHSTIGLTAEVHRRLLAHYDIDRWHWRADTPALDVCLGAILVQHTAWDNVEKALANLRGLPGLSIDTIDALDEGELAQIIRPAGTPAIKARRLKALAALVLQHGGFEGLFRLAEAQLRDELLATHGIGPETADVILLYAARQPAVVHDAYTARLYRRLGSGPNGDSYSIWRAWLDANLPQDVTYRGANHASIVVHCKQTCRVRPHCQACPLQDICSFQQAKRESNEHSR